LKIQNKIVFYFVFLKYSYQCILFCYFQNTFFENTFCKGQTKGKLLQRSAAFNVTMMQIGSTKVFYFEKYFENTILFCIFKKLFRSILHITVQYYDDNEKRKDQKPDIRISDIMLFNLCRFQQLCGREKSVQTETACCDVVLVLSAPVAAPTEDIRLTRTLSAVHVTLKCR